MTHCASTASTNPALTAAMAPRRGVTITVDRSLCLRGKLG
jgi:hypothetical protein